MNNQTTMLPQIFFYSGSRLIQRGKNNVISIKSKEDFVIKIYNPNKVQISAQITYLDKIRGKSVICFDICPEETIEIRNFWLINFISSHDHSKIEIQCIGNELSEKQLLCDATMNKASMISTQIILKETFTFVHEYETIEYTINYCPYCGKKKLDDNWVYCPECGIKYNK